MTGQHPNVRLVALLEETGWTGARLAKGVNALGAESGMRLHYDRTSVAHWLRGAVPRPPVPALINEAFSRRLGRPVQAYEEPNRTPMGGADVSRPAAADSDGAADPVARLVEMHADRRLLMTDGIYQLADRAVPDWARASAAAAPQRAVESGRIDRADGDGMRLMIRVFLDTDLAFGGGRAVDALAAYLARDVAPRLRGRAAPRLRRRLFAAATKLAYLCRFMHFDMERQVGAQQYYRVALDLAAENQDPGSYATVLRAMSVQAHTLGHHRQAMDLAEASLRSGSGQVPAATMASLHGQAAVTAAGAGDKHSALSSLRWAERFLDRGTSSSVLGSYHEASLAHQRAAVLSALGDTPGAVKALAVSVRYRPGKERRARAITLATLAQLQLQQGHLDLSVATCHQLLDGYEDLDSGRVDSMLAALRASMRAYPYNQAVKLLWDRAARLTTGPAGGGAT